MKLTILLLNKIYISLLYIASFLSFLSLQIKLLSFTQFYDIIMRSSTLAIGIFILLSAISLILTLLLIHLLRKLQQHQLD